VGRIGLLWLTKNVATKKSWRGLQSLQESNDVFLLIVRQLPIQDEVKIFDRIIEGEQPSIVQVRRGIFHSPKRKSLYWPVGRHHHSVNHMLLVEAIGAQIVQCVIRVVGRRVAGGTLALAEKDLLPVQFLLAGLGWVKLAIPA
jgi:hypothetical protein